MCENLATVYSLDHFMNLEYDLRQTPLFKGIDNNTLDGIIERTIVTKKRYQKGDIVVPQNNPIDYLYLLVDGAVSTEMLTPEGNIINIDILDTVVPLALAFIYADQPKFPVAVVAMQPTLIYLLSKEKLRIEMMKNETLFSNFLQLTATITTFLSAKVAMLSVKSLKSKIARYILDHTTEERSSFTLNRNQTQLAEYFGVQRPSLARTIGELVAEGIITVDKRKITVCRRQGLVELGG